MAIKDILKKVFDFGIEKKYFRISTIGKLDKSCCIASRVEIIDFDETKTIICKNNNWVDIKSCDGLKILAKNNRIDFIEMKSIVKIFEYQKPNTKTELKLHIENFDFISKIRDSLMLLSSITQEGVLNKKERADYHKIPKQPILLTDIDFIEDGLWAIMFTLNFLENMSNDIRSLLKDEIQTVRPDTFNNILQPKLMDCKSIDEYYKLSN
jgi:hypothetical protein